MKKIAGIINPKLLSSLVMLIIIGTLLTFITFSWFSENREATATGMSISALDTRVDFGPLVTIVRSIGDTEIERLTFKEAEAFSLQYYLWDEGNTAFVLDEEGKKIPITIDGLLPGERVDFTFSYTCADAVVGKDIAIYFDKITSETFTEIDANGESIAEHSVLCVYKMSVDTTGTGNSFGDGSWLVQATTGNPQTVPDTIPVYNATVDGNNQNGTITFRLDFDLDQYEDLLTATNQLSEKGFSIGALRIEVLDDES